jgi:hypothetical protein
VRGAAAKPLLHLWSENYNLTRRVLAITDHSEERLSLAVERFGHAKPDRLEFIRLEFERAARDLSREAFCNLLRRLLAEQFPDESVESLITSPDLEHSLSGNYVRGMLRRGSSLVAILAVPDGESSSTVEGSLTFGLLWLDRAQHSGRRGKVTGLRLILPKGMARHLVARAAALTPDVAIEFYERDPVRETFDKVDPRQTGNLESWLVPHRESQALLDASRAAIEPIASLSPCAVTIHPAAQSREVWLRFRGLPFARWDGGRVFFGCPETSQELLSSSFSGVLKRSAIRWPPKLATFFTARNPSAGSKRSFVKTLRVSTLPWIPALSIRRCSRTPEANMAFSISSPLPAVAAWRFSN